MKKFILFIAVITLSFGSAWADIITIPGTQTSNVDDIDNNIPFNMNATGNQVVTMILPTGTGINDGGSTKYTSGANQYITGFAFYANGAIPNDCKNLTCTLTIGKVSKGTTINDAITLTNPETLYVAPKIEVYNSNNALLLIFKEWEYYQTGDNDLYVKIETSFNTAMSNPVSWYQNKTIGSNVGKYNNSLASSTTNYIGLPKMSILTCEKQNKDISTDADNNYDIFYNEHTKLSVGNSPHITLVDFKAFSSLWAPSGTGYITYSSDFSTPSEMELYDWHTMPAKFTAAQIGVSEISQEVAITKIGNNAFNDTYSFDGNVAVLLNNQIQQFGNNSESNKCFDFKNSTRHTAFIITSKVIINEQQILPTVIGDASSGIANTNVYLYLDQEVSGDLGSQYSSCGFGKTGGASNPYSITLDCGYDNNTSFVTNFNHAKVTSMPYKSNVLTITLDPTELETNNDGTFHSYKIFTESEGPTVSSGLNTNTITYSPFNAVTAIKLKVNYDAILHKYDGNPFISYTDIYTDNKTKYNSSENFLNRCDNMIFEYSADVPQWRYEDNSESHQEYAKTLQTGGNIRICVEKEIYNTKYMYFSLPFNCPVGDIICTYSTTGPNTGTQNTSGNITLLQADFDPLDAKTNPTANDDYFVILEYKGQTATLKDKDGNEEIGHAEYVQIKDGTLSADKGYVFAIYEADKNIGQNVTAKITLRSADAQQTFYHDHYQFTFNGLYTDGPKDNNPQYTGWNFIGNPYYNYVGASIYNIAANKYYNGNRAITLISEDDGHNYIQVAATDATTIKPFQVVALQTTSSTFQLNVPTSVPNPYKATTTPASLPAEDEVEITEMVAVDVWGSDNIKDVTTIINDEFATDSFVIGNDMGKLCNPTVQLFSLYQNVQCAVKSLPLRQDSTKAIPLGLKVPSTGNYTFALDTTYHLFYGQIMLHDKQNGQYHTLNHEGVTLNLNAGLDVSRFEIVVIPEEIPSGLEEPVETSETLDAYVYDSHLVVENIAEGSTLSIYDISGKLVYNSTVAGDFDYNFSARGVYMVVLRGNTTGTIKVVY